jgi:transposase
MIIRACALDATTCPHCEAQRVELDAAHQRIAVLEAEATGLREQLREALKVVDLQKADLDRLRAEQERTRPNRPERAPSNEMQLALERVVATFGDAPAANDVPASETGTMSDGASPPEPPTKGTEPKGEKPDKPRHPHGRRRLDLTNLPVETIRLDPDEVLATGGKGFEHIGDEVSERIAFKPAQYIRLRLVRRKFAPIDQEDTATQVDEDASSVDGSAPSVPAVLVAPLPGSVLPRVMADPSAIAHVIISKYDDVLPLHRQERISLRNGFVLPRSTQCGWMGAAHSIYYRVVDAMFDEGRARAFCIATDATGAPVRAAGACAKWTIFVFIADRDHVVFCYAAENTSAVVSDLLRGFRGNLLADAAPVYDALYRGGDVIEHACWFHCRRYFFRALESERELAMEALAIIGKLFETDRGCREIEMPVRTAVRSEATRPVLAMFDKWVERHRDDVDPGGRLDKAIGYYDNQRGALHRFLDDGRLRLDNNISETQLRNVVLGVNNWTFFANETGLKWYTTFRSLIASCRLHGLNPQDYLEQLLRLGPHWPVTRMLELSPKYWATTLAGLDAHHRTLLVRPWEIVDVPREVAPVTGRAA